MKQGVSPSFFSVAPSAKAIGEAGPLPLLTMRLPVDSVALHLFLLASLAALWCLEAAASDRTPSEQLERMSSALRSLNYEGTIVYLHENRIEVLRIIHRVEGGQIRERMVSLNGPVRTLTREKGSVTCQLSNSRLISVQRHDVGKDMLHAWTLDPTALSEHYRVHPLGAARVAGRQAEVVGIIPRDHLRYGYRFYLDEESGLPLKSDLMGQMSDPIEQIMFTSLDLFPAQESATVAQTQTPQSQQSQQSQQSKSAKVSLAALPWRFDSLPAGFQLVMHDNWRDPSGSPVEHLVLSDGLASVSAYIEGDPQEGLEGSTRIGAVHAAGKRVLGHQVTVVGEVPLETVEAVLAGLRRAQGAQP